MDKILTALTTAGIPARIRFNAVGDCGEEVVRLISEDTKQKIGGDAILRIDERFVSFFCCINSIPTACRQSLRFTFVSPSTLTAHLAQATLAISSIPQLSQLLVDEIERFILTRICEIGTDACELVNGTWFLDLITSRSVGRWDGYVL
jgi:mediator of RNA polymerase II transcription subunit 17